MKISKLFINVFVFVFIISFCITVNASKKIINYSNANNICNAVEKSKLKIYVNNTKMKSSSTCTDKNSFKNGSPFVYYSLSDSKDEVYIDNKLVKKSIQVIKYIWTLI